MGKYNRNQWATYLLKERNGQGNKSPPEVSLSKEIDPLFKADKERVTSVVRIVPFEERLLESDLRQNSLPFQLHLLLLRRTSAQFGQTAERVLIPTSHCQPTGREGK
ncbi:uncharacterized protein AKAW2_80032A [Aspergillus luchuensis]|uniref:Uncharacterized protein n=1 Tax=Aspergillus kawachii TaxID=1069201 RepID=A0A7R7WJN6_ASPKA|nr:uncharacterized protein AKAW2_80032A [Aspergillus luchuensis]BCS04231.1 hypothetical protein AKAW2_80032A [Aspergillus luchuensis]